MIYSVDVKGWKIEIKNEKACSKIPPVFHYTQSARGQVPFQRIKRIFHPPFPWGKGGLGWNGGNKISNNPFPHSPLTPPSRREGGEAAIIIDVTQLEKMAIEI